MSNQLQTTLLLKLYLTDEMASQIVDEVHFPNVTEVNTVEQQIELDNIVDSDRESEIKSL